MYITCETYKWVDRQGRPVPTISQSCPPPPTGVFPSVKSKLNYINKTSLL